MVETAERVNRRRSTCAVCASAGERSRRWGAARFSVVVVAEPLEREPWTDWEASQALIARIQQTAEHRHRRERDTVEA